MQLALNTRYRDEIPVYRRVISLRVVATIVDPIYNAGNNLPSFEKGLHLTLDSHRVIFATFSLQSYAISRFLAECASMRPRNSSLCQSSLCILLVCTQDEAITISTPA